jgi:hypothetical protein
VTETVVDSPRTTPSADRSRTDNPAQPRTAGLAGYGLPKGYGLAFGVLITTTLIAGLVSFLFSFGNVRALSIYLGLPGYIQPLTSPAVDTTVVGLIIVIQWLATAGATKEQLKPLNNLLIGAGVMMMVANCAPSVILGWLATTDEAAGKLYGKAVIEAFTPALLICWAHVGPYAVRLFVEIRQKLADRIRVEGERRAVATAEQLSAALADRATAAEELSAVRERAAEEMAAAAAIRQAEQDAADRGARERELAEREFADRVAMAVRDADAEVKRRMREAELLVDRAQVELSEARRIRQEAAADRQSADEVRAAAAADRAAAEELVRESVDSPRIAPVAGSRTRRTVQSGGRKSADQLTEERVEACKSTHFKRTWRTTTPTQKEIMEALNVGAGQAAPVRRRLEEERLDAALDATASLAPEPAE